MRLDCNEETVRSEICVQEGSTQWGKPSSSSRRHSAFRLGLRTLEAGTHLGAVLDTFAPCPIFTIKFRDRTTSCGSRNIWNQVSKRLLSWALPRLLDSSWVMCMGRWRQRGMWVSSSCSKLFYKTFIPVLLMTPKSCYLTVLENNKVPQNTGCR